MTKAKVTKVYVLKVALVDSKRIWRRIAIRGDQTLDKFHRTIFEAFDRFDPHLYSFYFPKPSPRGRERLRDATEYTHPYMLEERPFDDRELHNAAAIKIDDLKLEKGQRFDYLFDFGDSWQHEITVEQTDGAVERGRYPRIQEKRGESPSQYSEPEEDEGE
jgi:hypothetical protein